MDPFDGTKNFVRGVPVWATLVALQVDGVVEVGVVSAPPRPRWWAGGARRLGRALVEQARAAGVPGRHAGDASLSYSSLTGWAQQGRLPGLLRLSDEAWRTRAYGDFWCHVLVAEGAVDACFEPEVCCGTSRPLQPVVEEAGGPSPTCQAGAGPTAAAPSQQRRCCTTRSSRPSRP